MVNASNGVAGHILGAIQKRLWRLKVPVEFSKINNETDGEFPNGVPNPILKENRA